MRVRAAFVVGTVVVATAIGCNEVLGLDDFDFKDRVDSAGDTGTDAVDAFDSSSCIDPTGFHGNGCFSCEPTVHNEIVNACTGVDCFPFDAARVPDADASPSSLDAGSEVAVDAADAATDSSDAASPEPCESFGKPIYVVGSTALLGVLETVGKVLGDSRVLVYKRALSCEGVTSIYTGTPQLTGVVPVYGHSKTKSCTVTGTKFASIGISDVAFPKCGLMGRPEIEDFTGPVQVFMFAAPAGSAETSVSHAAAQRIFRLGASSDVAPWTDGRFVMIRPPASGTQITLGSFVGLLPDQFRGTVYSGSEELANACASVAEADRNKTICITSADQKDIKFKKSLKTLAYQHVGQRCGFLPDANEDILDKRNVRDGHYVLWAPVHFFALVDGTSGQIKDDDVRFAMNLLTGRAIPVDPTAMFAGLKGAGLVPSCAMRVRRNPGDDFGDLSVSNPEAPCGCAFENVATTTASDCKRCLMPSECPSGTRCSFGFCEPSD